MKHIRCTKCGNDEFTYKDSLMICSYCGAKYTARLKDIELVALPDTSNTKISDADIQDTSLIHEDNAYLENDDSETHVEDEKKNKTRSAINIAGDIFFFVSVTVTILFTAYIVICAAVAVVGMIS